MGKCALIVDDSKTSRVVLSRILETHELAVDTVVSAEDAFDYLHGNRPDVIFMDHLMPGMDGLEAVEVIKNDPKTATIPIMMYTSQKGEVYVGQARALGAVGVLPKEVEPVEVSRILESLHIIGEPAPDAPPTSSSDPNESADASRSLDTLDNDMRLMIEDLFDQQRAIIKRDIRKSSEAIAARVADQIKEAEALEQDPVDPSVARAATGWSIATVTLAVIVGVMIVLYTQLNSRMQDIANKNSVLREQIGDMATSRSNAEQLLRQKLDQRSISADSVSSSAIAAIAWGFNRSAHYAHGQEPLGDSRLADFEELSRHLIAVGFAGQILVETYSGEYCLVLSGQGYELAPDALPAATCDVRSMSYEESLVMSGRQSVGMAEFMSSEEARSNGRIRYEVIPQGTANPLRNYPPIAGNFTAGEWNRIAGRNNRIKVTLLPDP